MQITRFELRLLSFFHNIYLKQHSNDDPAQQRVWTIEVPILWQHSDLVRQSIFLLSAMILWNFCDLDELYRADTDLLPWSGKSDFSPRDASTSSSALSLLSVVQDFRRPSLECGIDGEDVGHLRWVLFTKLNLYFNKCLCRTQAIMQAIEDPEVTVASTFEAAEIVILAILLFLFLALEPHSLVPLLSFESDTTDLLSLIKGMKVSMGKAFPLLYTSGFSGLFSLSEHLHPPTLGEDDRYVMVEILRKRLREYAVLTNVCKEGLRHLSEAVNLLEIVFYRTIESHKPLPIFRYVFLIDCWVCDEIKLSKDIYCLKIVYVYACLCFMCKLRFRTDSNIFIEYMRWYQRHNLSTYNRWKYEEDEALFELITEWDFEVDDDFGFLKSFDPVVERDSRRLTQQR